MAVVAEHNLGPLLPRRQAHRISGRAELRVTQLFSGGEPLNNQDFVLQGVPRHREKLIVDLLAPPPDEDPLLGSFVGTLFCDEGEYKRAPPNRNYYGIFRIGVPWPATINHFPPFLTNTSIQR